MIDWPHWPCPSIVVNGLTVTCVAVAVQGCRSVWMVVLFVNQAYKLKNLFQTSNKYHGRTLDLKYNYLIMKPLWLATESHKILAKPLILVMFNKFIEYGRPVNVTVSWYWPDGVRNVPVPLQYPSWPWSPDLTPPMLCRQYWSSQ